MAFNDGESDETGASASDELDDSELRGDTAGDAAADGFGGAERSACRAAAAALNTPSEGAAVPSAADGTVSDLAASESVAGEADAGDDTDEVAEEVDDCADDDDTVDDEEDVGAIVVAAADEDEDDDAHG